MLKKVDLIGIENLIMDFALLIDKLPETDGFGRLEDYLWQSGGNVSSAIVAASRLGLSCSMISNVGDDAFGKFCLRDMERYGVDTTYIKSVPHTRTTFCICLADRSTMGRSILGHAGSTPDIGEDMVNPEYITQTRYLHIGVYLPRQILRAVEIARKNGVIVSMDGGAYTEDAEKVIPQIDILIISESFHDTLFKNKRYADNCRELLTQGPKIAIVTLGKRGCVGADGGGVFQIPAFTGHEIIDTTGAGDVFHGGFLYAHAQGWDVPACAKFASAVSYINCTSLGGRAGIPTRKIVDEFLNTGVIDRREADGQKEYYRNSMFA
jgi:sugar/nucleoside kinase (ribokinase family)